VCVRKISQQGGVKERNVRRSILLSIPITCTLKALTSMAEIILLLKVNLSNLFFPISSLTEATGLSKMNDSL
jgi:hypothetical protein